MITQNVLHYLSLFISNETESSFLFEWVWNLTINSLLRNLNSEWANRRKYWQRLEMGVGLVTSTKNSWWVLPMMIQGLNFMEEIGNKFQNWSPPVQAPKSVLMLKNTLRSSKKTHLRKKRPWPNTCQVRSQLNQAKIKTPPTTRITLAKCSRSLILVQRSA